MSDRSRRRPTSYDAPVRILLAHDLSPASDRATALISAASWPAGTTVRVVSSPIGIGLGLSSLASLSEARARVQEVRSAIMLAHEDVAADLLEAGVAVETTIVHGRPERAILLDADEFAADLIVVGARQQGSLAATLLGSVSRAVVANATCSILVARDSTASRVVLAVDDSAPAKLATAMVAAWPRFAAAEILVVGVGDAADHRDGRSDAAVDAALGELTTMGRTVQGEIRHGDAAIEVVAAARAWGADVVAIGAHGEPFLRRAILGSVAGTVIDGVSASVLVARPTRDADPDGPES